MARRRVRVLSHDQHPDVVERLGEGPQHVLPGGKVPPSGGDLRAQEGAHPGDLTGDWLEGARPARLHDLVQRLPHAQHSSAREAPARVTGRRLDAPGRRRWLPALPSALAALLALALTLATLALTLAHALALPALALAALPHALLVLILVPAHTL